VPEQKEGILENYQGQVDEVEEQWDQGFISDDESLERTISLWTQAKNEVEDAMKGNLWRLNPIFMMADSGARGNYSNFTQLAGMRGLMTNTKGEIIPEPVKSNFIEGLSVLEYFTSTHGARKGQATPPSVPADSGYLTRRPRRRLPGRRRERRGLRHQRVRRHPALPRRRAGRRERLRRGPLPGPRPR
jgi:DNA-directed RNA polymerase subunit beta'